MPSDAQRASILLVHDDSELLDLLTTFFEQRDFEVAIAATGFSAHRLLQSREFEVIVSGWRVGGRVGAEMYEWVLSNKYKLRGQFVFLAERQPDDFEELVQGRCLCLHPNDLEEIVRVAEAAAQRQRELRNSSLSQAELQWVDEGVPTLLLVDDEPILLMMMVRLLRDVGFDVIPAESGNHAIALLRQRGSEVDVVLSDWYMPDGSGPELYTWLREHLPALAERCVFLSAAAPEDFQRIAPGRMLFPKGQDSPKLISALLVKAQEARDRRDEPAELPPAPFLSNPNAAEAEFELDPMDPIDSIAEEEHDFDEVTGEFQLD